MFQPGVVPPDVYRANKIQRARMVENTHGYSSGDAVGVRLDLNFPGQLDDFSTMDLTMYLICLERGVPRRKEWTH